MMNIVVSGAGGFIGSHLCDKLIKNGHRIMAIDNMVSGRGENLEDIFYHNRFTLYRHDVSEFIHIGGAVDWVIHLASLASPMFYSEHPIKTLKVGALGTHKTLGLAKEKGASYLFASTSEVYGSPEVHPQPESYRGNVDPFGPRSCYDESKRYAEAMIRAYRDKHDIDIRIARIFNTYGPRMRLDDGRVIPNFMRQALTDAPMTVYGDGSQTRSFCHVDDLIEGLLALMASEVDDPVNIGNPDERTILELAELIREVTGSSSRITHEDLPPQDPPIRRPDISRARSRLGWEPEIDLLDGLERSLPYFEAEVAARR